MSLIVPFDELVSGRREAMLSGHIPYELVVSPFIIGFPYGDSETVEHAQHCMGQEDKDQQMARVYS
jgi:hypothetical protein